MKNIGETVGRVKSESEGAGDGIRTHKGVSPVTCEVTAFTSFATLAILAIPKAKTSDPTRTAASRRDDAVEVGAAGNQTSADRSPRARNASRFSGYVFLTSVGILCRHPRQGLLTNRTQLIRDVALAFGKTCIACGREAVSSLGNYPVCVRHRTTVKSPDPNWKWKNNVRTRHARRIFARACAWCGRRRGLTRHHDWAAGSRGLPPRPVVLCRRCHRIADSGSAARVWYWRLKLATRSCKPLLRLWRLLGTVC